MTLVVAQGQPLTASSHASLADRARDVGVRFILATFTTLNGKPCSKLVPVEAADELESDGVGFAGFAAGGMGQLPSDPDLMAVPDVDSFTSLTFLRPGLGMVHCDPTVDGVPFPFAPRVILKKALEKAAAKNLTFMAGAEVEYFLLRRDQGGVLRPADELDDAALPCYDSRGVSRMYDHLTAVSDAMLGLGWRPYANDHEDGNGQFEQNFRYADALTTADRVVTMRYLLQMFAEQRGMIATFMPKPFSDRTGNGLHLHLSLWEGGDQRFPAGEGLDDAHGLGLSPLAYAFVGGLLDHAPALHALVAPTVNSYKRTGATTTSSGATWAPRSASYGGNDRTHMIRVPDSQRVELRAADGSACSYLAVAGALAAGLDGIERDLDPGPPGHSEDPLVQRKRATPRTLLDAVHSLEADAVISGVLDAADPTAGVSQYYAQLKREEFYAWHNEVTAWEIDRYLTAV